MSRCYSSNIKGAYESLCLSKIAVDLDVLKNFQLNPELLRKYTYQFLLGDSPALAVIYDGHQYWLADNCHWLEAAIKANMSQILCDVRSGTRQQAIQSLIKSNAAYQQISAKLSTSFNFQKSIQRRNSKLSSSKH
jgi:hypothetical protein